MSNSKTTILTKWARAFLQPSNTAHRHYEALRAFFVDRVPSATAARRFGYSPGSFRVLCHQFRHDLRRRFFIEPRQQPRPSPNRDRIRERIIVLRKQNLSIYDISRALGTVDIRRTPAAIAMILAQEGFARLPRRHDEDCPPQTGPAVRSLLGLKLFDRARHSHIMSSGFDKTDMRVP